MKRVVLACLAAGFLVACQGDGGPLDLNELAYDPAFLIADGQNGGNPDFFWLPPLVPNPTGNPDYQPEEFNPDLSPAVQICEGIGTTGTACDGPEIALFTMTSGPGGEFVRRETDHYHVNWHTDEFNLDATKTYRMRVLIGTTELGFADVDVVSSGKQLKNVNTNEYIGLKDGRTLPVKFSIENAALCDPPGVLPCASKAVDLNEGSSVALETADDVTVLSVVDIPPQTELANQVTITMEPCEDISDLPVDMPLFGGCFTVTADPPLQAGLEVPAIVSVCHVDGVDGLTQQQAELVTLLRYDGADVQTLPHAPDNCFSPLGNRNSNPLVRFARNGWGLIRDEILALVSPEPLVANTGTLLHRGGGGETIDFSQFQFGLPVSMTKLPNTDEQLALVNDTTPVRPGVLVTDARGEPAANATVHFEVLNASGEVMPAVDTTDFWGIAEVDYWRLGGTPGEYQLRAYGYGIAASDSSGPLSGVDPFWTDFDSLPPAALLPFTIATGNEYFTATATEYAFEQNGTTTPVQALIGPSDITTFYSYGNPNNASSNTQVALGAGNGLETSETSVLFLYEDNMGDVSLVMIHDKPNDGSGGKAIFTFSDYPVGTSFLVRDDVSGSEGVLDTSIWRWLDCCTDGGALGPVNPGFMLNIAPDFPASGGLSAGQILYWQFVTGSFANREAIDLDMNSPITIRRVSTP